jgi:hypothetical protein
VSSSLPDGFAFQPPSPRCRGGFRFVPLSF